MSKNRLTVVISQAPGKNPTKRALEESLAAHLLMEPGIDLSIVPHLYDLGPDHTGRLFLESVSGDLVVLAWLFPRASYWLLDRDGIKGREGSSPLHPKADEEDEDDSEEKRPEKAPGIGIAGEIPDRTIWCLDLRDKAGHEVFLTEVRRIAKVAAEERQQRVTAKPPPIISLGLPGAAAPSNGAVAPHTHEAANAKNTRKILEPADLTPEKLLAPAGRRWYPVIDYSRCTNCLECLDFCLFGVYGVDGIDRIVVENQDSCKKGCPACSRVCPEQAIIFPDYKSPAIAGAPVGAIGGLKIDLSKLFGGDDAMKVAASERDRELVRDGRDAVGLSVGIPKRQAEKSSAPKDELDSLVDALDNLGI